MAVAALSVVLLATRARPQERRPALVAGGLAGAGFALGLILAAAGFDDLITRNILPLWLPAAVLVAAGLALARAQLVGAVAAAALCAIGVAATAGVAADRNLQRPDWRYVARALAPDPAPGAARVILIQHYRYRLPLSLYLPRLEVMRRTERVSELDVISIASPPQPLCWWGAACNLIPSRMQSRYDVPGFDRAWRRHVLQFTILRLTSNRPVPVSRAAVAAALRTTRLRRDELLVQLG